MRQPRQLTEDEYRACFSARMIDVTETGEAAVDVWLYVDGLDLDELGVSSLADVRHVYRDDGNQFDHVLIATGRFNAFLVIVVNRSHAEIVGHHLLDLNTAYGLAERASSQ